MENSILKRRLAKCVSRLFAATLLVGGPMGWLSCTDDLLTGTPAWLGSSIYEELESRGDFKTTLALINDPDLSETNYPEMLRRTGSVTLFVADDAAWSRFLQKRGVSSVSDLSKAEKKNLLKGSMINNAYLIELLSNKPGDPPAEGSFMRRASRMDISDSIPVAQNSEFPIVNPARVVVDVNGNESTVDYWAAVRDRKQILLYKDNTEPTMVHFTPDFMLVNDLVKEDIQKLTNGECQDVDRSYINGRPIAMNDGRWPEKDVNTDGSAKKFLQDITCQNGYIHVLEEVAEPLPNMAEIIRTKPQFSIFSSLLERYSYPQFIGVREVDGKTDSIFVKRYFNEGHADRALNTVSETDTKLSEVLSLDPGWNNYRINSGNADVTSSNDGAAIFVPTNEWMQYYITSGDGKAIGVKYGYNWDNVPDEIVLPFLNNCMKNSLITTSPSKFENVKNTESEVMGLTAEKVDSCFMACNGVVYQMNAVYVAPDHQSVFFPVRLRQDEDLSIMYRFISDTRYKPGGGVSWTKNWTGYENKAYVNSMASTYSFLLPKDTAFAALVDPFSLYDRTQPVSAIRYYVDALDKNFPVSAQMFECEYDTLAAEYVVTDKATTFQPRNNNENGLGLINNRLTDFFNNLIVVHGKKGSETFHPGRDIYLTKGGNPIKVQFQGTTVTGIAGSAQMEKGTFIPVENELTFDLTENGNGVSYVLDEFPTTTLTTPYQLLNDTVNHLDFLPFANLLESSSILSAQNDFDGTHVCIGRALNILGNFHYTIFVPRAEKINALIAAHKLPSEEEYDLWKQVEDSAVILKNADLITEEQYDSIKHVKDSCQAIIQTVINNFIRYHVQDGSVYLGGEQGAIVYETASYDDATSRFRRLNVNNSGTAITVTDARGHQTNVVVGAQSNLVSRQYVFEKSTRWFYVTSPVVIHMIDDVLLYSDDQLLPDDFPMPTFPPTPSEVKRN